MTFGVQDKEASIVTEKLKQFVHVDVDAIPHVMVSGNLQSALCCVQVYSYKTLSNCRKKCACL